MTDLDVNYTINIIENITASLGTNNLFDVISDPTRKLVDDVTTSYRLFSYLSFPRLVYETLCRWKSKCKLTRLLVWNFHILLFCYEINLFLFIFMKVNFIF